MKNGGRYLFEKLSIRYADYLYEKGIIEEDDKEVHAYGMLTILCNGTTYLTILIISLITNLLPLSISFLLAFSLLRIRFGGWHTKSPGRCFLMTILVWGSAIVLSGIYVECYVDIFVVSAASLGYLFYAERTRRRGNIIVSAGIYAMSLGIYVLNQTCATAMLVAIIFTAFSVFHKRLSSYIRQKRNS